VQDVQPVQDDGAGPAGERLLKPFSFTGWGYTPPPPPAVAERRIKLEEESADRHEAAGFPDLASEDRKTAAWWQSLADCPEEKAWFSYIECETDARELIDVFLARAEGNEGPLGNLFSIAFNLLSGLHALAANGNKKAAAVWANILAESIEDFEKLAWHKPEIIAELARGSFAIPGMISRNKEKTKSNAELVKRIEVGADYDLAIVPTGKRTWKFKDRPNGLAARLKSHIDNGRTFYGFDKLRAELPAWRHDAMKLEPFSPETWETWAKIAWSVLAEISPDGKPGQHPAFYEPATKICNVRKTRKNPYYGNEEDAPSIAEYDIKEKLFGAFEIISRRKKGRKPL